MLRSNYPRSDKWARANIYRQQFARCIFGERFVFYIQNGYISRSLHHEAVMCAHRKCTPTGGDPFIPRVISRMREAHSRMKGVE